MNPLIVAGAGAALFWLFGSGGANAIKVDIPTMRMFHVDWCGHCQTAKPEFAKLLSVGAIDGKPVRFELRNAEQEKLMADSYGVRSYPTFVLTMPNGDRKEYRGERTASAIGQFVKESI